MVEIWKDIIIIQNGVTYDYTGYYKCNNIGEVRRSSDIVKKSSYNNGGYKIVRLNKNGKGMTFKISRIVAQLFVANPLDKPYVNHKNGIKDDDRWDNLEWCTPKENVNHAFDTGLCKRGKDHHNYGKPFNYDGPKTILRGKDNPLFGKLPPWTKLVLNTNTGIYYDSIKEAAYSISKDKSDLAKALNGKVRNHTPFVLA